MKNDVAKRFALLGTLFIKVAVGCDAAAGACRENLGGDRCCTDQDGRDASFYCDDGHKPEYEGNDCNRIIFGIPAGRTYRCCKEEDAAVVIIICISVGVSVLIIVGIIVGVWCYCKKARRPVSAVQGVVMPAQPASVQSQPQPAVQSQPQQQGKAAQLKELKELFDNGALTQDEFDSQKKEVLAGKS